MLLLITALLLLFGTCTLAFAVLVRQRPQVPQWLGALACPLAAAALVGDATGLLHGPLLLGRQVGLLLEGLFALGLVYLSSLFVSGRGLLGLRLKAALTVPALLLVAAALLVPPSSFFLFPSAPDDHILFVRDAGFVFYLGVALAELYALLSLEQCLAAVRGDLRWQYKLQIVGLGTVVACFFLFHLQALLFRTFALDQLPFIAIGGTMGAALAAYGYVRRGIAAPLVVSQRVVYGSLVLVLLGGYLLVLGLAGKMAPWLPIGVGRWGLPLLAVVLSAGLILVLLSERVRRRLQVTLHKHLLQSKYEYRDQWMAFTETLGRATTEEALHRRILEFFCQVFQANVAGLFLRGENEGPCVCAAQRNLSRTSEPLVIDALHAAFGEEATWVVDLQDTTPVTASLVPWREAGLRFLVPIVIRDRLEGVLGLGAMPPRERLSYEDYDLMKVLACQAGATLLALRLTGQLSTQREMAAMAQVATFALHDIKNHVSGLRLLHDNARSHIGNPEFQQDMLATLQSTIDKMHQLMGKLRTVRGAVTLHTAPCDLAAIAGAAVRSAGLSQVPLDGPSVTVLADVAEIEKVVLNLLINARDAVAAQGGISLQLGQEEGRGYLRVTDTGCGMSEDFVRHRLFRALETTKEHGLGVGMYQCRQIVQAHGGTLEVVSVLSQGTAVTVWLPLADVAAAR